MIADFESLSEEKQIEEQQRFISFLEENGIYNKFESALSMQKMHEVWRIMQGEIDSIHEEMAGADI